MSAQAVHRKGENREVQCGTVHVCNDIKNGKPFFCGVFLKNVVRSITEYDRVNYSAVVHISILFRWHIVAENSLSG
jgi:hypothetical protein